MRRLSAWKASTGSAGQRVVAAGRHQARWAGHAPLPARKLGPDSTPQAATGRSFACDLVAQRAGAGLEALAQPQHGPLHRAAAASCSRRPAIGVAMTSEAVAAMGQRRGMVGRDLQFGRQVNAAQVALVAARRLPAPAPVRRRAPTAACRGAAPRPRPAPCPRRRRRSTAIFIARQALPARARTHQGRAALGVQMIGREGLGPGLSAGDDAASRRWPGPRLRCWASNMAWKFTSVSRMGGKPARVQTSETMARR